MFHAIKTAWLRLLLVMAGAALGTTSVSASPNPALQLPPALEATVVQSHEALRLILNGDPSGYAALFADRDDITLGNPFGPFGKGRVAVLANLNNAAKKYTHGSVIGVERVAVYGGGDRYVLVEIEHDRARLGTAAAFSEFSARVTSVYERIGEKWKLVHRHADPITSARPAESMLSSAATSIVGTWRLLRFEDFDDGKVVRRFGEKPNGLFVYTADGHLMIQIANPANPVCITPAKSALPGPKSDQVLSSCKAEQFERLLDGTVAYWGTYTVDESRGIVTHDVIADVANGYAGTAQPRPFRLDGNQLILGDGKTSIRVLERAHN
jgi:ketosteroid isomerase-like protein